MYIHVFLRETCLGGGPVNKIASSYSLKWYQQECFASPECVKQLTRNLASLLEILCILASGLSFCLLKTVLSAW